MQLQQRGGRFVVDDTKGKASLAQQERIDPLAIVGAGNVDDDSVAVGSANLRLGYAELVDTVADDLTGDIDRLGYLHPGGNALEPRRQVGFIRLQGHRHSPGKVETQLYDAVA